MTANAMARRPSLAPPERTDLWHSAMPTTRECPRTPNSISMVTSAVPMRAGSPARSTTRAGQAAGLRPRFGLYRVDNATQQRTPKLSAEFFRACAAANAVA
jgi:hypothetical protein